LTGDAINAWLRAEELTRERDAAQTRKPGAKKNGEHGSKMF
jgi:hypothetical protein